SSRETLLMGPALRRHRDSKGSCASPIELRTLAGLAVEAQGPSLTGCIRPREDPVLPRRQPRENLGLASLRPGEPQAGLHAGERIRTHRDALFDRDPDLVIPVEVVGREGHETEAHRLLGIQRPGMGENSAYPIAVTTIVCGEPRDTGAHGQEAF